MMVEVVLVNCEVLVISSLKLFRLCLILGNEPKSIKLINFLMKEGVLLITPFPDIMNICGQVALIKELVYFNF